MLALFCAGWETLRVQLEWVFLLMAAHPEVQQKMRQEIDEVIGREGRISWSDRRRLPYTMAVISEIYRWTSILPIDLPRKAIADVRVQGALIPKDSLVFLNFWSVHYDEKLYPNPSKFDPNRFFDHENNAHVKRDEFVPFSGGKRNCAGQVMGEMEVFIYLTSVIQKMEVLPPVGSSVSLERCYISTLTAKCTNLQFRERVDC